jgi:hypothetical protein
VSRQIFTAPSSLPTIKRASRDSFSQVSEVMRASGIAAGTVSSRDGLIAVCRVEPTGRFGLNTEETDEERVTPRDWAVGVAWLKLLKCSTRVLLARFHTLTMRPSVLTSRSWNAWNMTWMKSQQRQGVGLRM